ncbi:TetR family transcriptional regulator [Tepidicaulis marinus]|uniref:TetR family transcriptional regulator n=1 Tax=Tepidicaulis marinus TaxID=1333998 RepID=A0A081B778_9HYPH|nr:hypothetical protein [Tepidicaulis marinus]GAK43896.1 TetR family transcriptional regulator [Tepidicaulis marinus]
MAERKSAAKSGAALAEKDRESPALRAKQGATRQQKRAETEARILDAAHLLLKEDRLAAFSLRGLAARLDMRLSHLQHYFPHASDLLARLFERFIEHDSGVFLQHFEEASGPPEQKLQKALARLLEDEAYLDSCDLFMSEMAALAREDARIARSLERYYAEYRKGAADLLARLNADLPPKKRAERAALVVSLIEGALHLRHPLAEGGGLNAKALAGAICALARM